MKKIIKVTKKQLKETEGNAFKYLDIDNDTPSSNGNSEIGVTGKVDDENYGIPSDGDKIANSITPQGYNRYRMYGSNVIPGWVRESDNNNDGVDDFYNHEELDILDDGDDTNNLIKIPRTVEHRLDMLIQSIKTLTSKQQAMVINKLIKTLDLKNIPYSWSKELMYKIFTQNNIGK